MFYTSNYRSLGIVFWKFLGIVGNIKETGLAEILTAKVRSQFKESGACLIQYWLGNTAIYDPWLC